MINPLRWFKRSDDREERATFRNPTAWLWDAFAGGPRTVSGERVSPATALQLSAVWACVRVISETVASLPLHVYQREERGRSMLRTHPLARVLAVSPNPEMTAFTFRETLQHHLLLWGNCYAEIKRNNRGDVAALWPLSPDRVEPWRDERTGMIVYRVQGGPGDTAQMRELQAGSVFHVVGLGYDGLVGYAPVRLAREMIGAAAASEKFGAAFFGNGASVGGVLEHPGSLSDEALKRLRDSWEQRHRGVENASRTAILEEGMKYARIGIPPEDAQFLETRKFSVEEIARWFGVPLHKIQHLEHATFSNIEHQALEFITGCIRPWLVRWEAEIARKLITRPGIYAEHSAEGLLRGDIKSRYEAYAVGRQWGWLTANEIRGLENLDATDDGDQYLVPMNMTIPKLLENPPEPPAPVAPPAEDDPDDDEEAPEDDAPAEMEDDERMRLGSLLQAAATRIANREHRAASAGRDNPEFVDAHAAFVADALAVSGETAAALVAQFDKLRRNLPADESAYRDARVAQILESMR